MISPSGTCSTPWNPLRLFLTAALLVVHGLRRTTRDENSGAPSIERPLLDGWETTKANRRPLALSIFYSCFFLALSSTPATAQNADGNLPLAGARQVFDGAMLPAVEVNTFSHSDT